MNSFLSLRSSFFLYSRKKHPECQCHHVGIRNCQSDKRMKREDSFERDIDDIADSAMEVMCICGIRSWIVKKTREAIKQSMRHFDEIRYRIDRVPIKRFCKESFIYDLGKEAGMSRTDAQLAYSIVKRAFRAYYHGTALEGKRFKLLAANMKHRQECLWLHAAKRTAEIYAAYTGLMYSEQLIYQERFECVYKCLHDVLQTREIWEDQASCVCASKLLSPITDERSDTDKDSTSDLEVLFKKQSVQESGKSSFISIQIDRISTQRNNDNIDNDGDQVKVKPPRKSRSIISNIRAGSCQSAIELATKVSHSSLSTKSSKSDFVHCLCPQLYCDREFDRRPPMITAECSQGPYICRWLPYDKDEEEFNEHRVPFPPMEVICPICPTDDLPCDSECTCTCDFCRCSPAYEVGGEEEHHNDRLSATGLEDYDTDYCWLAPFRDWPRLENPSKEAAEKESGSLSNAHDENALFQCKCTCDIKQRAFPHLFTYLAPFSTQKAQPEVKPEEQELPEEKEIEDLANKRPPRGISVETYRCWNLPVTSTSNDNFKVDPLILVLPRDQKKTQKMDVIVTVKKQHHSPTGNTVSSARTRRSSNNPSLAGKSNTSKVTPSTPKRLSKEVAGAKSRPQPNSPNLEENSPNREPSLTKNDIINMLGLGYK